MIGAKPIRVALAGCGAVADFHLRALRTIPTAQCVALFDIDRGRAEAFRARHRLNAEIVTDLDQIPGLADSAIVAVPNAYHADYSIRLLRGGINVLCEKPLAVSSVDAQQMMETAQRADRVLACGLVRRFFGSTDLAVEALSRELVGTPITCEVYESNRGWPFSRASYDPRISGGGILIDLGPHVLDLLSYLLGDVEILEYRDDNRGGVEANASLRVQCALKGSRPVPASIYLSRSASIRSHWKIICSGGVIEIDPHERDRISVSFDGGPRRYIASASAESKDPFESQLANFFAAVDGDESLRVSTSQAVASVELIEKCYALRERVSEPWAGEETSVRINSAAVRKVLVTGAAGLVGSRLVEMWEAQGQLSILRCLVRSYTNAARIMRFPVEVFEGDLLNQQSIEKAVEGCDAIIHLGAGEKAGRETQVVLDAALKFNVQKFIHVSSASVYGLGLPAHIEKLQEDSKLVRTGELYADGKARAEFAARRAARRGLPVVILRPQVVYGPAMRWSAELMQLLLRDEICILEDGGWANLIYIDDLVSAISRALDSANGNGEAFFITDGSPIPWREYILAHARLIGANPPCVSRTDVLRPTAGLANWMGESLRPLLPVLRTEEFRSFVTESPLMQATVFRAYLALRERSAVRARLERMRNGGSGNVESQRPWNSHWIKLQLSEARLSAARAEEKLGFRAQVNFAEGLQKSAAWFERCGITAPSTETANKGVETLCLEAIGE